jgi:hypothetical protein
VPLLPVHIHTIGKHQFRRRRKNSQLLPNPRFRAVHPLSAYPNILFVRRRSLHYRHPSIQGKTHKSDWRTRQNPVEFINSHQQEHRILQNYQRKTTSTRLIHKNGHSFQKQRRTDRDSESSRQQHIYWKIIPQKIIIFATTSI